MSQGAKFRAAYERVAVTNSGTINAYTALMAEQGATRRFTCRAAELPMHPTGCRIWE